MTDETQGAAAPETDAKPPLAPDNSTLTAHDGVTFAAPIAVPPALEGVDAWAAAFTSAGVNAGDAPTLATNCLRDGFEQGVKACAVAPDPMPYAESLLEHIEDDVIWAAEEAAYHASNLVAEARGRKPDDGIDAWRKRTGGLRGLHHGA